MLGRFRFCLRDVFNGLADQFTLIKKPFDDLRVTDRGNRDGAP